MANTKSKNAPFKTGLAGAIDKYLKNTTFLNGMANNGLVQVNNPKWLDFEETGIRRKEALVNNSVTQGLTHASQQNVPPSAIGGRYNPFANVLYASLDSSKANRIYEYRLMASYPEVADAIEEISNGFITLNEFRRPCTLRYTDNNLDLEAQGDLQDEFNYFIESINLKANGAKMCRDFLIDGEVFYELIINNDRPENKKHGVLGMDKLKTELMDAVYKSKENGIIGAFIGKKIVYDPANPEHIVTMEHVPYHPNQVMYITSNNWDPTGQWIVPFIERARKRYIQLSYLEDAIIIYRLVRAPERLIFTVDTGNMPAPQAEQYLASLRHSYWKTKTFDINTGDIMQKFEPQAMLDSFWMSKGQGNEGINVTQLAGGQNLGQLDDLDYFVKALYRALRVPSSRLNSESSASTDGSTILQEELRFAELIISIQKNFAESVKQAFISHLKFQGKYQSFGLRENCIDIEFVPPSAYFQMRNLQGIKVKSEAFASLVGNPCFSQSIMMKQIMGMDDNQVLQHYRMRKAEAAKEWEIEQIKANGPNWQSIQLMQNAASLPGGAGGDMGGGDMGMGGGDMGMGGDDMGMDVPPEQDIEAGAEEIDAALDM